MSVCKYFQTNSCRFGSRCRNRHVYEQQHDVYDTRRKPSGVSVLQRNKYVINHDSNEKDISHHLQEVCKEISASESIWPASCYCYLHSHGNLQGFEDVSPEEFRFKAYEAGASNPQEYIIDVNNLKTNISKLRKSFLNKTPGAQKMLSDYLNNEPSRAKEFSKPSGLGFDSSRFLSSRKQNTPSTPGVFPSASQNTGSFNLNDHPAFRGQSQSSALNSNIFAQVLDDGNNSAPPNISSQFMPNIFGQALQPSLSQSASFFGEPFKENTVFRQNIFGSATQAKPGIESTITAAQASQSSSQFSFSNNNAASSRITKTTGKCLIYSQEANLTPEELEQFKATTFTYGKTPLKCPPRELC